MLAALIFLAGDHNFTQWLCFDMFLSVPMEAELYFLIYCCVVLYNQCSPDCLCCFFSLTLSSDKCLDRENKVNRSCYQICLCYPVIALYLFTPIYLSILYLQAYWISYSIFIDDSRLKICVCVFYVWSPFVLCLGRPFRYRLGLAQWDWWKPKRYVISTALISWEDAHIAAVVLDGANFVSHGYEWP